MTSDYTIMWKVNSSEYLLDTNITWCLIVEKIDLMNLIISWHAQKRESRVGTSSLLIHSYIRFIHPKTVSSAFPYMMVLYMRFSGSLSTCFFSLSAGHMPSLVGHPERMPRPFQTHSPTTKNDVRHLWYSRLWMDWFQGMISDQRPKSIMVATGSPSVAQVWSLWLALRRFTWERRGFPPFLLEVFNNYTIRYVYIYI